MTPQTLIDVQAANADVRERMKRGVTQEAMAICGATKGANAFLLAVEFWQDATREIERKGYCLACGGVLVDEATCAKCGRDNR